MATYSLIPANVSAAADTTIRPFRINVPEEELINLRRRVFKPLSWGYGLNAGSDMRRRDFFGVLGGGVVALPLAARAQSSMPHVGVLRPFGSPESDEAVEALRAGLHDLGYDEGRNIVLDIRYSETVPRRC